MTTLGKVIFLLIVLSMYGLSFLVARTSSIKAIEKIFVIFFGLALLFSIIFSEKVWDLLPKMLSVGEATDSVLYLFIIVSTGVNLILVRKILELELRISKIVQHLSINKSFANIKELNQNEKDSFK